MAVSNDLLLSSLLLHDCQRILIILNKNSNFYTKLQLQIEFEYYHFQKRLNLTDVTNRFNRAYDLLVQNQVCTHDFGHLQVDTAACNRFIQTAIVN